MLDKGTQKAFREAAFDNPLFFFNAFCWVFEPRAKVKVKPFVTWPHQDPAIMVMDQAITDAENTGEPVDVVVDKSRGQGATWMYLMVFLRRWLRDNMFTAGLVTRNEDLVDSATNADTLMWKIAWMIEMLPPWMLPPGFDLSKNRNLSEHVISNPVNRSTIVGHSATGDVGRGGRRTVFAMDEMASFKPGDDYRAMDATQYVTNCRFLVSTFSGDSGAYFEAVDDPGNARVIVLDWKDNPTQNQPMYRVTDGVAVAKKPEEQEAVDAYLKANPKLFKKLERRGHAVEGRDRSPYYDSQCLRPNATPRSIAKELDRNPKGTVGKIFSTELLDEMRKQICRSPLWQGKAIVNDETFRLSGLLKAEDGPLKLWFIPGAVSIPPTGPFAIGCDIAAGTGGEYSSNSAVCAIDIKTGEQVLEYTTMHLNATKFARLVVGIAHWLNDAYLCWESSGPTGSAFGNEVVGVCNYRNIYYRTVEEIGSMSKTRRAGWANNRDSDKADLFEKMAAGMEAGEFLPRSDDMIRECGEYEWDGDRIIHRPTKQRKLGGLAHGDRCIAAGVAWLAVKDRPGFGIDKDHEHGQNLPYGSPAWRHQMSQDRGKSDEFGDFSIFDLLGSPL